MRIETQITIGIILIAVLGVLVGITGANVYHWNAQNKPVNDFYNFGNHRVYKDSIYSVKTIYSEDMEIEGYYVEFQYNGNITYIECLGVRDNGNLVFTPEEEVESYLINFKIADGE